jgi:hypothetical protein
MFLSFCNEISRIKNNPVRKNNRTRKTRSFAGKKRLVLCDVASTDWGAEKRINNKKPVDIAGDLEIILLI